MACDIVAREIDKNTGLPTGKVSQLHRDLLGLGKLVKKFNRKKANKAFFLSQAPSFQREAADIYEGNEPSLVKFYEKVKELEEEKQIASGGIFDGVTNEVMIEYLSEKQGAFIPGRTTIQLGKEDESGIYSYHTAFAKAVLFNREMKGANTFMGTVEPIDLNGKMWYAFKIVLNSEEEQLKFIDLVEQRQLVERVKRRLEDNGTKFQFNTSEDEEVEEIEDPAALAEGFRYIYSIRSGEHFDKDVSVAACMLIIKMMGKDHPLIQRLSNALKKEGGTYYLSEEDYDQLINNHPDDDIEERVDRIMPYVLHSFLSKYNSLLSKNLLLPIANLLTRIVDWCAKTFSISDRDFKKALYESKYAAWNIVLEFMGDNFYTKITPKVNSELIFDTYTTSLLEGLAESLRKLDATAERLKSIDINLYKTFKDKFKAYSGLLNLSVLKYSKYQEAVGINLANTNAFTIMDIEQADGQTLLSYSLFIINQMSVAQTLLLGALDGIYHEEPITIGRQAEIIKFNLEVYDLASDLADRLMRAIPNVRTADEDLANELDNVRIRLGVKVDNTLIQNADGSTTKFRYGDAIFHCRRDLAMRLLRLINGSDFLHISLYVTLKNPLLTLRHFKLRFNRHDATLLDLEKEVDSASFVSGSLISRFVDSMAESPDALNLMLHDCIEELKHSANIKALNLKDELLRRYLELKKITWIDRKGEEHTGMDASLIRDILYETYNSNLDKYGNPIKDKDFNEPKPSTALTGNFVTERNWGEWERAFKLHMKYFELDAYRKSFTYSIEGENFTFGEPYILNGTIYKYPTDLSEYLQRVEYVAHFEKYLKTNHATIVDAKYRNISHMLNSVEYNDAYGKEVTKWHSQNSALIDKLDAHNNPVSDPESGRVIKIWAPHIFSDGNGVPNDYDNDLYALLLKTENTQLRLWLEDLIALKRELDDLLPEGSINASGVRAPQFLATLVDRISNSWANNSTSILSKGKPLFDFVANGLRKNPDDTEFGSENDTYDDSSVSYLSNDLIRDKAHFNTINSINRLPVFGVRRLANMDNLSTDPFQSLLAYGAMAYLYDCLNTVVGAVEQTAYHFRTKRTYLSDLLDPKLYTQGEKMPCDRLEDYIKMLVYNLYATDKGSIFGRKLAGKLGRLSSWWFLKGNFHSALTNEITGLTEIIKEAGAGENYTIADTVISFALFWGYRVQSVALYLWNASQFEIPIGKNTEEVKKWNSKLKRAGISYNEPINKWTLFKRHYNVENENYNLFRDWHILSKGYGLAKGGDLPNAIVNLTMWPYSVGDETMLALAYMGVAKATMLYRKSDLDSTDEDRRNNPLKISLWKFWKEKNGELVSFDGSNLEDWCVIDKNTVKVKEILEKKKKMGLPISAREAEMLNRSEYVVFDEQQDNRYRLLCRGINNRLHGVYNRDDAGAWLKYWVTPLILSLKKYLIGMCDRRFATTRYDFRIRDMREGSAVTTVKVALDFFFNPDKYSRDQKKGSSGWDTKPIISLLIGTVELAAIAITSIASPLYNILGSIKAFKKYTDNPIRRRLLKARGYSDSLITNIDRTMMDMLAILFDEMWFSVCMPPEKKEDIPSFEEAFADRGLMNKIGSKLYLSLLKGLPGRVTINDNEILEDEAFNKRFYALEHMLPFSMLMIGYYLSYRALKELLALNLIGDWRFGLWPEIRSSLQSFVPGLEGGADLIKLILESAPAMKHYVDTSILHKNPTSAIIERDNLLYLADMGDEEVKKEMKKKDYGLDDPYGADVYSRTAKKDFYKYAWHIIKTASFLRTLSTWCLGYSAARNMEYAAKSEFLKLEKRSLEKRNNKIKNMWAALVEGWDDASDGSLWASWFSDELVIDEIINNLPSEDQEPAAIGISEAEEELFMNEGSDSFQEGVDNLDKLFSSSADLGRVI